MSTRVAINGFGRIGRQLVKAIHERYWNELELVAVAVTNSHITDIRALLLERDSIYGRFNVEIDTVIEGPTNAIRVDGRQIDVVGRNPYGPVPEWRRWGVDLVIEATGYFKDRESAGMHVTAGAKRVLITAPGKGPDATLVMGVNESDFDPLRHVLVSNASCTTNALAPAAKVIFERYGIRQGILSTVHSYTSSQSILDNANKDPRRSRAAAINIVPTTTGAAKAVGAVIPELAGRFHGSALRIPTPTVSLADFTALVDRRPANADEVNAALREGAAGDQRGVLDVVDLPLVSSDYIGNPFSSIADSQLTQVRGDLVKTVLWYDNEWGYSCRVADMAYYMSRRAQGADHATVRDEVYAAAAPHMEAAV